MNNLLSENLKRLRLSGKYTQEQAAQLLAVSPQTVSRWETAATMPDVMLLPKIAEIYGVTVDDLFRENAMAYSSFAARLGAVYESTSSPSDFVRADNEFSKILEEENFTTEDLRLYGILNQHMMMYCKEKAEKLLDEAAERAEKENKNLFYRIKRQKLLFLCQTGRIHEAVKEQEFKIRGNSENSEEWLLLILAYHYCNDDEKAYKAAVKAVDKFPHCSEIYGCAGDICKAMKKTEEAFKYWDAAMENDESYLDAKCSKAFCLEEIGDFHKAYILWCEIADKLQKLGYEAEAIMPKIHAAKCKEKI